MKPSSPSLELRPVTTSDQAGYPTASELGTASFDDDAARPIIGPAVASALLSAMGFAGCGPSSPAPTAPPATITEPPATVLQPAPLATIETETEPEPAPQPDSRPEEAPPPPPPIAPNAGAGLLLHAFSWEKSALPIEWHPYGTGEPARLSEDAVRSAVERVFRSAGIALTRNVPFQRQGIACELDGYDPSKKIGYEFVSWQDLEDPVGFARGGKNDPSKAMSHDEIRRLMELEKTGQEHVIVISYQDDRFSWGHSPAKDEQKALANLEAALRSYISWLRAQRAL